MDNEILGYVIVKVDTFINQIINKYAYGTIKLKKIDNKYVKPDKREFGESCQAYIAANNTDFERNKYYLCAYSENKKSDVKQKIFINSYIEQINLIEIIEDEEEYRKKENVYWDDTVNKTIYKPINMCMDKYCIEGWNSSIIYKYTTVEDDNKYYMITLPSEKPDKYKDYLPENKDKLNEWIIKEIKTYNKEIQKEVEQILLNNINESIYSKRWQKGLEQFEKVLLAKNDERKDELIKIIDTFYYKKSEEIDKEIVEKTESIKNKDIIIKSLNSDIKKKKKEKKKKKKKIKKKKINKINKKKKKKLQSIKINLKNEINKKEEEKNRIVEDVNKEKDRLEQENISLRQQNIELKANLENEQINYLLRRKDDLIKVSIDTIEYNNEYKKEDDKIIIKKYDNLKNAIDEVRDEKHKRMIIYPNPKWVSFDDLWGSGFGAMFEMAHKNPDQLYVIIIQNYNLSPCECWSMPIVNLKMQYIDKLPYTEYIGFPNNLWLYFIESNIEDISFPVSEYFNSIFNENE